jgi:hypothetical protein
MNDFQDPVSLLKVSMGTRKTSPKIIENFDMRFQKGFPGLTHGLAVY